jgi:hypothetical protein
VRSDAPLCGEEKRAGLTELPAGKSNARRSAGERLVVKALRGFTPALDRCPRGVKLYCDCCAFVVAEATQTALCFLQTSMVQDSLHTITVCLLISLFVAFDRNGELLAPVPPGDRRGSRFERS